MAIKQKNIANGVIIGTTATDVYTVPTNLLRTTVTQARVVNTGAGPAVLNLSILQPGDVAADAFKAIATRTIGVDETYLLPEILGETIDKSGKIQAISDVASSLSFSATGLEETN